MMRFTSWAWMRVVGSAVVVSAVAAGGGCNNVQHTITGTPRIERPLDVVYKFDNVRRTPSVDEWVSIRRILYLHAKGSVNVSESNLRKFDQSDLRDYVARFTVPDASHIAKIQDEVDALSDEKVGNEKLRFHMSRAEISYGSDNLSDANDTIVRGVASPAATVKVFSNSSIPEETQADQYGAWAKRVKVPPGQSVVYGYEEAFPVAGKPRPRKYFKLDVFTMKATTITESQFNARPKK